MAPYPSIFLSTLLWAVAANLYALLGRQLGVRRLNFFKAVFSLVFFGVATALWGSFVWPSPVILLLLGSGLVGFALGDLFIFYGFSKMGAGRALMLVSFSPLFVLFWSKVIYGGDLSPRALWGVFALMACVFFLSLEKIKNFEVKPSVVAAILVGILLEDLGVVLSKEAFLTAPTLDAFSANFFRISIAVVFLTVFLWSRKMPLGFKNVSRNQLKLTIFASFLGTFLALYFFLNAISKGSPTVMAALTNLSPLYAAIFDHVSERRMPTKWFGFAIVSMFVGLYFIK